LQILTQKIIDPLSNKEPNLIILSNPGVGRLTVRPMLANIRDVTSVPILVLYSHMLGIHALDFEDVFLVDKLDGIDVLLEEIRARL